MTIKLEEFRLESYDERMLLINALCYYAHKIMPGQEATLEALENRLSKTQCQPGGCEYCQD